MNLPENGASMHDAANTRENERPCTCDDCDSWDECHGDNEENCDQEFAEAAAEDAWEAAREARE